MTVLQRRAKAQRMLQAQVAARKRYVRDLRAILGGLHRVFMRSVGLRMDAKMHPAKDFHRHMQTLEEGISMLRKPAGQAFDLMAASVSKANFLAAQAMLGVTPSDVGIVKELAEFREANIALVENAGRAYAQSVRDVFSKPENFGMRWEELKDQLEDRGQVSGSRAELIARDQTLRLNGALNELRQGNSGVEEYIWSTSKDERVAGNPDGKYPKALPSHFERDGKTFRWDTPPDEDPNDGHPGQNRPQCRCVAVPIIPGLEGL